MDCHCSIVIANNIVVSLKRNLYVKKFPLLLSFLFRYRKILTSLLSDVAHRITTKQFPLWEKGRIKIYIDNKPYWNMIYKISNKILWINDCNSDLISVNWVLVYSCRANNRSALVCNKISLLMVCHSHDSDH